MSHRDRKALLVTAALPASHPAHLVLKDQAEGNFFPRRHLFVTKEIKESQLCSVPQTAMTNNLFLTFTNTLLLPKTLEKSQYEKAYPFV